MIIFKKKEKKFSQKSYDSLFFNIENNLRELGYGDVAVNKKMKDLNKILYDILLKINNSENDSFKIVKWDTINLCNEKIYKCCGKTKKGEPCDKSARFFKNN